MADWHGMKRMWVDRLLDQLYGLDLWTHPWPWTWIFKVEFSNSHISGIGRQINLEWKGCWQDTVLDPLCNLELRPKIQTWLNIEFLGVSRSNIKIVVFQEWKKRDLNQLDDGCPCVTFAHDLDRGFSSLDFENNYCKISNIRPTKS